MQQGSPLPPSAVGLLAVLTASLSQTLQCAVRTPHLTAEQKAEGTHTLCIGLPKYAPLVVRVFHQFKGAKVSFSKRRRWPRLAGAKLCGHLNEGRRSQAGLWADPGEISHNKHEPRHKMCRNCPSQGSRRAPTSRAVCIVRVKGEA